MIAPLIYQGGRADAVSPESGPLWVFVNFSDELVFFYESKSEDSGWFRFFCGVKFFVFRNEKQGFGVLPGKDDFFDDG